MSRPASRTPAARLVATGLTALAGLLVGATPLRAQELLASWTGALDQDRFGSTVIVAGDVDGDGVPDLAVGAPRADVLVGVSFPVKFADVGSVRVYSGATHALLREWHGSLAGGDEFGFALAAPGDVNGDGFADLLVGSPGATGQLAGSGKVQLLSGADGAQLLGLLGTQAGARFGHALAVGDLDGDGLVDAAIGSPYHDIDGNSAGPNQEGFLSLMDLTFGVGLGSYPGAAFPADFPAVCLRGQWGASVVYMGDTNADGLGELAVGAPRTDLKYPDLNPYVDTGFVLHFEPLASLELWYGIGGAGDLAGSALARYGDPDGDGVENLAVGAPGRDLYGQPGGVQNDVGGVIAYSGTSQLFTIYGTPSARIGSWIAGAGDLTSDGIDDLLVGAPFADVGSVFTKIDAGLVQVRSGFTGELLRSYQGASAGDQLGTAMCAVDLDGLGEQELLLAAPGADAGGSDRGRVDLYAGVTCGVEASWSLYGSSLAGTLGVPAFYATAVPSLGGALTLSVHNSAGEDTLAFLFLGLSAQHVPVKGGYLGVNFKFLRTLPLPAGGKQLSLGLPQENALCGLTVFAQVLELDAGAPKGVSFSKAMQLVLGH